MSVAAPAALVEAAHKAAIDEINHAKLCFGLAHKFGGKPMGPGPFPIPDNTVHIATNILDMASRTSPPLFFPHVPSYTKRVTADKFPALRAGHLRGDGGLHRRDAVGGSGGGSDRDVARPVGAARPHDHRRTLAPPPPSPGSAAPAARRGG